MSGKRTKQLRSRAWEMIEELKTKHRKEVQLFSKQLFNRGEPCLFRQIKRDYKLGRIDINLDPIGV